MNVNKCTTLACTSLTCTRTYTHTHLKSNVIYV